MSSETITLLVKFLPTILSAIIILLCMLRGLMRGFRKSLILFIHYIISIAVGLVAYFYVTSQIMTTDVNSILVAISPDFSEAHSVVDAISVLLKQYLPQYAGVIANPYMEQVVVAIVGLVISLVTGLVCLVILPLLIRLLLRILYLLFYREGKYKKHLIAEGEEYVPHRFLGMLVGAARGLVCTVLLVSYITSIYFIASGGITTTETEETETNVQILDSLSETMNFDLNAVYKGLKESRGTGIGLLLDMIKIEGKPIDLYYTDLYLTSTFNTIGKEEDEVAKITAYLSSSEVVQAEIARLCIREELSLLVGLVEDVLETNIITIEGEDVIVHYEMIDEALADEIDEYISGSVLLSDLTPLALIGVCEAINNGDLSIGEEFQGYFNDDTLEAIRKIDIMSDLRELIKVCVTAIELVPLDENGNFNFLALMDIYNALSYDTDVVIEVFEKLSEIDLVTDLVFPLGIGFATDILKDSIEAVGIDISDLDLTDINWSNEIKNIGYIYKAAADLDLDIARLLDQEVDPETNMSGQMVYILELISDEDQTPIFKQKLLTLINTIFSDDTKLFGQVALVAMKSLLANTQFVYEDGEETPFGLALENVKTNLNYYTVANLRSDLEVIITSGIDAANLIPLFIGAGEGEDSSLFSKIYDIDTESLRKALLGVYNEETGKYDGGIYNISLLNGKLDNEAAIDTTDELIEGALKTFASEILGEENIEKVEDWRTELDNLVNIIAELQTVPDLDKIAIENFQSNVFDVLPSSIGLHEIDTITEAASKSVLLTGLIESLITTSLSDSELLGGITLRSDIVWVDTFNADGTLKQHGELNALLKSLTIFSDDEKQIDLSNYNSLLNGLGLLIHEATPEEIADPNKAKDLLQSGDTYLDYEEVIAVAKSEVLMTILSQKVSELSSGEGSLPIYIPDRLNTNVNASNWVYWSYDSASSYNYKQGEFAKLVVVLYHARNYAEANYSDALTTVSETDEVVYSLTIDNLLQSLVYMEKDKAITASTVLYGTVSKMLVEMNSDDESLIMVPDAVKQDPSLNDGIEVKKVEVENLFRVVRVLEVDLIGNKFDELNMGIVIDKADNPDVRKELCLSRIFAMTAINRLTQVSMITIPYEYLTEDGKGNVNHEVWYPTSYDDNSWEDCELNKMLASLKLLGVASNPDNKNELDVPENIDEILTNLNKDLTNGKKAIDVVYESRIFRTLVSEKILNDESGLIVVRDKALVEENFRVSETSNKNISVDEMKGLINYLQTNNISIYNETKKSVDIKLQQILDSLENEAAREYLSTSYILSSTIVNQIGEASEFLSIPNALVDDVKPGDSIASDADWYPVNNLEWENSEIARLLACIVELELEADENNELVEPDIKDLLANLGKDKATTNENEDSLTVAYRSLVIKETLKEKVSTANDMILVTPAAYDADGYIKQEEVKDIILLSEKVENIKDINLEEILGLIKSSEENRNLFSDSAILSATLVDQVAESGELNIPVIYTDDTGIASAAYDKDWYVKDSNGKNEVANLLDAIVELDITATGNSIDKPNTQDLLTNLGKDKATTNENEDSLTVAYRSLVIKETLKEKVSTANDMILVTEDAYDTDGYIKTSEVRSIISLTNKVDSIDTVNLEEILGLIKSSKENRELFSNSVILSQTLVDQVAESGELNIPTVYTDDTGIASAAYDKDWYVKDSNGKNEVANLLGAIVELDITATGNSIDKPNTQDLLTNLGKDKATTNENEDSLTVAYRSLVIKETLKEKVSTANDMILVTPAAYDTDGYLKHEEVNSIVKLATKVDNIETINLEEIIGLVKSSKENRNLFSDSAILSATFVDQVASSGELNIPAIYKDDTGIPSAAYDKDWYVKENDKNEVANLLDAIVELDVSASGNDISVPETQTLLTNLGKEKASTDESVNSLTVAYRSLVIKETLKEKVSTANDLILVTPEAYDKDGYLKQDEVSDIITLTKKVNNINEVDLEEILGLVKSSEENRKLFSESVILSATFVDQIASSGQFSIPSKFNDDLLSVQSAAYDKDWYVEENGKTEVANLLDAIVELDVKATGNTIDESSVKPTIIMVNLHSSSKTDSYAQQALDVTYRSLVIKETLADKVAEIKEIKARQVAYEKDEHNNPTKYFDVEELRILIEFITTSGINIDGGSDVDGEHIFKLLKDNTPYSATETKADAYVRMISTSNILNGTMVDIIGGEGVPSENSTLLFASWYLNADGTVNKEHEDWYPRFEVAGDYKASEIYHLLVAIEELGLEAQGNDIITDVDQIIELLNHESITEDGISKLDVVHHSDHIAKTISVRLNKFAGGKLPTVDVNGNSIYDLTGHRHNDVIIHIDEIHSLLHAVEVLGLKFHDDEETVSERNQLSAGSLTSLSAEQLHNNFNDVIDSAIIHHYISSILIDQTQDVNGTAYGIVTSTYYSNATTSKYVIVPGLDEIYVDAYEIDSALIALIELGITIDNVGSIDSSYLYLHFGGNNDETEEQKLQREQLISYVGSSAILSKIFSAIIMSNNRLYSFAQILTGSLTAKEVYEVKTQTDRLTLTQTDLMKVLGVVKDVVKLMQNA